jgi:hypothetical protein
MKVLSIKQPWAELILQGKKKMEIRKWNTSFRGEFLIHASKLPDKKAMQRFGFKENKLPCGSIVGKARLIDVKHYNNPKEFEKDSSLHLATQEFGNFGFMLVNIKRIKEIPAKGNLGFWNFPSLME